MGIGNAGWSDRNASQVLMDVSYRADRVRLLIAHGLITGFVLLALPVWGQQPVLSTLRGLKDVSIPLGPDSAAPTVQLHFDEIKSEPIRLGPFSFGLLPRRVIEGVDVRITSAQGSWASDLREFLQSEPMMAGVTLRRFRILDPEGGVYVAAKEATITQSPWGILLWDANKPGDDSQKTPIANLYLDGPEEGYLISADKSWKVRFPKEPRTDHEKK
jgi:hypothetical protein